MWAPGLSLVLLMACIVTKLQFHMSILETLLALCLAFCLSLLAVQATGATGRCHAVDMIPNNFSADTLDRHNTSYGRLEGIPSSTRRNK